MPIIRVLNWPSELAGFGSVGYVNPEQFIKKFISDLQMKSQIEEGLKSATLAAKVPGISTRDQVTVSFDAGEGNSKDRLIVLIVEGLFISTERTKDVRDHLAHLIWEDMRTRFFGDGYKVEVIIKSFDPSVDSYISPFKPQTT